VKKFVVYLSNKQKELMTEDLIIRHVNYLKSLKDKGVLPFCGPCVDGTAIMIINAHSEEAAKEFLENDPFSRMNYYMERKIVEVEEGTIENNFYLEEVLDHLRERKSKD
jgi:uncharacterized protein YciI